jgi:hypothetical protein
MPCSHCRHITVYLPGVMGMSPFVLIFRPISADFIEKYQSHLLHCFHLKLIRATSTTSSI